MKMTMHSMTEEIMSMYVVRATKKGDFTQRRFCGKPVNPDGKSFDIPAGLADYYKTVMGNRFTFSEPFLKDQVPKIEEVVVEEFETRDQNIDGRQGDNLKSVPENTGEPSDHYSCVCGYTAKQYMAFMRHVERCAKERRKKAKEESFLRTQEKEKPESESYLSHVGREETGLKDLIEVGNDYTPTLNAHAEAKE